MSNPDADVRSLLLCSCEEFLPRAYKTILGRPIDAHGAFKYAQRLQSGASRTLIIAELGNSMEARENATGPHAQGLQQLVKRYQRLCRLPIGRLRWYFLHRLSPPSLLDLPFDWERWADDHVAAIVAPISPRLSPSSLPSKLESRGPPEIDLSSEVERLKRRLEHIDVHLNRLIDLLAATGNPKLAIQHLNAAATDPDCRAPDPDTVSWEARSYLNQLVCGSQ